MENIDKVLAHPIFAESLERIEDLEADRIFCRHGLSHLLDVARIAYITSLERGLPYSKEEIYLAALMHDLGRCHPEAPGGHAQESVRLASLILADLSCPEDMTREILRAIAGHRGHGECPISDPGKDFTALIRYADKKSRNCFCCRAKAECYWQEEAKNRSIL